MKVLLVRTGLRPYVCPSHRTRDRHHDKASFSLHFTSDVRRRSRMPRCHTHVAEEGRRTFVPSFLCSYSCIPPSSTVRSSPTMMKKITTDGRGINSCLSSPSLFLNLGTPPLPSSRLLSSPFPLPPSSPVSLLVPPPVGPPRPQLSPPKQKTEDSTPCPQL